MTNDTNTGAIFAAFIEADKALKELPQVKADLAEAYSAWHNAENAKDIEAKAKEAALAELAALKSTLAAKEAELASAMFREQSATGLVNSLRSLLGAHIDPTPLPVPALTEPTEPTPTGAEPIHIEDYTQGERVEGEFPTQSTPSVPSTSTVTPTSSATANSAGDTASASVSQSEPDPTLDTSSPSAAIDPTTLVLDPKYIQWDYSDTPIPSFG